VVADLGGGSIELTDVADGIADHGISLPLGTLQLAALREAGAAKFARKVQRHLGCASLANTPGHPLYLVGGSSRSLARYAMHRLDWPLDDTHGLTLDAAEALRLFRSAAQGQFAPKSGPRTTAGISTARLAAMPDAAALLGAVVRQLEPSAVVFSGWGLREGLLYTALSEEVRGQDPLIVGVSAWVEPFGITLPVATMVAGWTMRAAPSGDLHGERLRLAATMLALANWHVEPNLRCDLALDWALRKRWIGIDSSGRAQLAMAALASTGRTEVPEALNRLASPQALSDAVSWGLATRLCRKLTTCVATALAASTLSRTDDRLVLTVREPWHPLVTDTVEKELRALSAWLKLDYELRRDSM
jgi:exopolyphosphatase/guanosine-5'-triphosphate,3'-diphosphate pyrophosphatase